MTDYHHGWACTDCMMLLCNGETPPEMSEEETAAYLALIPDEPATPGRVLGELGCECEDWDSDTHREVCEHDTFSPDRCDMCHRPGQAGERHAITLEVAS